MGEKVGKMTIPPTRLDHAGGEGCRGFDRNPYLVSFEVGDLTLLLANVHSIFAGEGKDDMLRRTAETRAIAWWCEHRSTDTHAFTKDILALGDFNLPKPEEGDPIFDELTGRGLQLPEFQTKIGTTLDGDRHYDQVAYVPDHTQSDLTGREGCSTSMRWSSASCGTTAARPTTTCTPSGRSQTTARCGWS